MHAYWSLGGFGAIRIDIGRMINPHTPHLPTEMAFQQQPQFAQPMPMGAYGMRGFAQPGMRFATRAHTRPYENTQMHPSTHDPCLHTHAHARLRTIYLIAYAFCFVFSFFSPHLSPTLFLSFPLSPTLPFFPTLSLTLPRSFALSSFIPALLQTYTLTRITY